MTASCDCCAGIVENGTRRHGEALYVWRNPNGYVGRLCASCAGWWLLNAIGDPDLMPSSVELLEVP